MSNRIRDIFSDDRFMINGKIRFKNEEAYKSFISALEMVRAEEVMVPVDGVVSISSSIEQSGMEFPLPEHKNISRFVVTTHKESIRIPVTFNEEKRSITLYRTLFEDRMVLESRTDSIVYIRMESSKKEGRSKFTYKVQLQKASSVDEIAYSFESAFAFISRLFAKAEYEPKDDNGISLTQILWYFQVYSRFFRRLHAVENELEIKIKPEKLNYLTREDQNDIDELYLLLCEKQILRRKGGKISTEITLPSLDDNHPKLTVGSKLSLSFLDEIIFSFLDEETRLFGASLIVNAMVTDIQQQSDGSSKILYGDVDDKPLYIAYSAFKTELEAQTELETILQHESKYISAKTYADYARDFYPPIQ